VNDDANHELAVPPRNRPFREAAPRVAQRHAKLLNRLAEAERAELEAPGNDGHE
jgi:hypothetical protein